MRYILSFGIFLSVLENFNYVQVAGFLVLGCYLFFAVLSGRRKVSLNYLKNSIYIAFPFFWAIVLSVTCLGDVYLTLINVFIKVFIVFLIFGILSAQEISRSLRDVVYWHTSFFLAHFVFLLLGFGGIWDKIIFLDTQTDFSGVGIILFRATGLFDEPSLFGMTILALILSNYLIEGSVRQVFSPLMTFSLPTMFYATLLKFIEVVGRRRVLIFFAAPVVIFLLLFLTWFGMEREGNVRYSPFMLRLNHYVLFLQSDRLLYGNGFCSAYGRFDLDMGREELRNLYLGNFKDAGQTLFIADRIGLVAFILFVAYLFRKLKFSVFLTFFVYLSLSKVPYFSITGVVLFAAMAIHLSRCRDRNEFK